MEGTCACRHVNHWCSLDFSRKYGTAKGGKTVGTRDKKVSRNNNIKRNDGMGDINVLKTKIMNKLIKNILPMSNHFPPQGIGRHTEFLFTRDVTVYCD